MSKTTWRKLKSGEWGIQCEGYTPKIGERVTVTKADGGTSAATVKAIVWQGPGVCLCAVESRAPAPRGNGRRRGNLCAECGKPGANHYDREDGMMKHYGCCDIP